jgi:hypothetical protein
MRDVSSPTMRVGRPGAASTTPATVARPADMVRSRLAAAVRARRVNDVTSRNRRGQGIQASPRMTGNPQCQRR